MESKMARSSNGSEREKYWKVHVANQKSSGLSQKQYCINHNISPSSLGYWIKKFTVFPKSDVKFFPVTISPHITPAILPDKNTPNDGFGLVTNQGKYRIEFNHYGLKVAVSAEAD